LNKNKKILKNHSKNLVEFTQSLRIIFDSKFFSNEIIITQNSHQVPSTEKVCKGNPFFPATANQDLLKRKIYEHDHFVL